MINHTRGAGPSKMDARFEVRRWLKRGVKCVPLNGKKPTGGEGWNKLRVNESTIATHFKANDNIGGLWGEPSNWIVDIDLDCEEAIKIARSLMPDTFVYGREKRPGSHYLYRCRNALTQKWIDENREMIVELRSTGSQSVLPPSVHPDDDVFRIENECEFEEIPFQRMTLLLNRVAALSLLVRNYPHGGGRHDYISAVAGALSHSGLNDDDVMLYCTAILDASEDRESDRRQRERTIKNTIEKAKDKNNHTYGWPTLDSYMSSIVLSKVKTWIVGRAANVPIAVRNEVVYSFPAHLLNPPGLVGELTKWSGQSAYVRQPIVDLAAAFMCLAMASLNRYVVSTWKTPLQPYIIVMAPTAGGKESALGHVYEFCRRIRLGEYCFRGFQSYHSMLDRLGEAPNLACWLWDEAGRKFKSAGRNTGSPDYQVMTWLLDLYGKAALHVPGLTARGTAIQAMDFPFLTILAASQPSILVEAVSDVDLNTGLVNRFLMFDAGDAATTVNINRDDTFPSRIETAVKALRDRLPREGEYPFHMIQFEVKAYQMFREFEAYAIGEAAGAEIWGRANQNALILAGLLAVGMGESRVTINEQCAAWAIDFVRWSVERWLTRIKGSVARTKVEGFSKGVEKVIRGAREYVGRARENQKALLKKGFMPRAILGRCVRHLDKRELDSVLAQLIDSEIIGMNEVDGMLVYWPIDE